MWDGLVEDSVQDVYVEEWVVWVVVAGEAEESVDPTEDDEEEEEEEDADEIEDEEDNKVPDGVVVYLVEILEVDG